MLASSSVFSAQQRLPLTSFPRTPMPLTSVHIETALVFSWTSFLCPTAWIHAQGLRMPLPPSLAQAFAELDAAIADVLLEAQAYGTVFVLAEDSSAYIEDLCSNFFPRCATLFATPALQSRIQLLCAATEANTQWYSQMLHSICTTSPALRGSSVVLTCFGPDALRAACIENAKHLSILPKTIRSNVVQPTPAQVFEQLCLVRAHLVATVTHHSAIDVVV
ncbi:hypothetical protein SDRG_14042 [Saprolegnia diclina VS20]|uniref:Uncharacterized protein n=1 Tax=Saprolegnia diclina (strain VS20) TaxID=1156394 RepID=T0R806_SAPDV|nr:hypothetical protein SDRG_14042 [Saprolegnia diclina VS20]EQC28218.1 hypothetical protein SDRG_14042 [Saprolegnia diclina VS20]|eukprot:XP_008618367.1 hypothetical protein SDRG_14042 [Saprolegnia diclina VS20]